MLAPTMALKSTARRLYEAGAQAYLTPTLRREARQPLPEINEGSVQYEFALAALTKHEGRRVLDVGTGLSSWPRLLADCGFEVTAVDEFASYWGGTLQSTLPRPA